MALNDTRKCARCKGNVPISIPGYYKEDPPAGKTRAKYYHMDCWNKTRSELALGMSAPVVTTEKKASPKNMVRRTPETPLVVDFMVNHLGMTKTDAEKKVVNYVNEGIRPSEMLDALRYYYLILGKEKTIYGFWVIPRYYRMGKEYYDRIRLANEMNKLAKGEVKTEVYEVVPRTSPEKQRKKEYELE